MDSGYLAVVLAIVAGFFLLVAMTLQMCACVRTIRQTRMEKARLREIQEAAAESPPPYALVILDRNFQRPSRQNCQCQVGDGNGNRNICSIVGTSPSSTAGQNPNFQRTDEPTTSTAEPLSLTGSNGTFCMLCFPHQRNMSSVSVNSTLCREMSSSNDGVVISIPTEEKENEYKTEGGNEIPPTYEEAIRYSISEEVS